MTFRVIVWPGLLALLSAALAAAGPRPGTGPPVTGVAAQPLLAQARRVAEALEQAGSPLPAPAREALDRAAREPDEARAVAAVQAALDPLCLVTARIRPDSRLELAPGPAPPVLVEQGWRAFLIKIHNEAGATSTLRVTSPNALPVPNGPREAVAERWLDLQMQDARPLYPTLSGLEVEYRVLQLYSRDAGKLSASLAFNVGRWSLPADAPGDAASALIREWRFGKGTDGWEARNQCAIEARDGVLRVTSTGRDPYIVAPIEAPGGRMTVRFRARSEQDGSGQVFWWTRDARQPDGRRTRAFPMPRSAAWKEYAVSIPVEGELAGLRLDPGNAPGRVEIEAIVLAYEDEPGPVSASLSLAFEGQPSREVTLRVRDEKGKPATAAFVIRDAHARVYPAQVKRLAPDFFFHAQIYRADGEKIRLPEGTYTVECRRGPESIPETRTLEVGARPVTFEYRVRRWIDPARRGWWSGDHHIHAAGCAHYTNPTEGVHAADMARHIMGEDLKVGANLTWGPCFDYQKQFFTGAVDKVSKYPYLLRYDIEVSGFGSHQSGHLCLLRLKEQMYPGGDSKDHWPTLGLNTLRWAKKQGAVTGPAHSGIGLTRPVARLEAPDGPNGLPSYAIPAYDGIGANEFIMNVTHQVPGPDGKPVPAVDFISTMNTDRRAELNMWYHTLNCGFRVRASGETDFPCVSGERVGLGRVYVKQRGKLTYDDWCEGIREGRSYVSDGHHHLLEFRAAPEAEPKRATAVGEKGSEVRLAAPGAVTLRLTAAARREGAPELPVELVVNGYPVARQMLRADGRERDLTFTTRLERSAWVAARIFPSAHTNPIWVLVEGKPVRASRRSAEWCLRGVDQCWSQKERFYRSAEHEEARRAYDHAREVYRRIREESPVE